MRVGDDGGGGGGGDGDGGGADGDKRRGHVGVGFEVREYNPARRLQDRVAALDAAAKVSAKKGDGGGGGGEDDVVGLQIRDDRVGCADDTAMKASGSYVRERERNALREISHRLTAQAAEFPSGVVRAPRRTLVDIDAPWVTVVHVSDTHRHHDRISLPRGDLLLHTGDILDADSGGDPLLQWASFLAWVDRAAQQFKHGKEAQFNLLVLW